MSASSWPGGAPGGAAPATADERIKRVEEVAEQMEEERKKGISCRKKVSRFFRRSLINLDRSIRRCFGK